MLPKDIFESARIDGVNKFQEAFYITIPMIISVLLTTLLLQMIGAMKSFDLIWVMTEGGPGRSTRVMTLEIYLEAFRYEKYGYGISANAIRRRNGSMFRNVD